MVPGVMIGIILLSRSLIANSTPTDKDSESSKTASKGCYYKGQYYKSNWEDGCDYLCTCLNPDTGYYKCRRRCPRYESLPSNCVLVLPPGAKCCKQPECFAKNRNDRVVQQGLGKSGHQNGNPDIIENPNNLKTVNGTIKGYRYAGVDTPLNGKTAYKESKQSGEAIHNREGLTSLNIQENKPNAHFGVIDKPVLLNRTKSHFTSLKSSLEMNTANRSMQQNSHDTVHKQRLDQNASATINDSATRVTTAERHVLPDPTLHLDNTESNNSDSDSSQPDQKDISNSDSVSKDSQKESSNSEHVLRSSLKDTANSESILKDTQKDASNSEIVLRDTPIDTSNPESVVKDIFQERPTGLTGTTTSSIDNEIRNTNTNKSNSISDSDTIASSGDNTDTPINAKSNQTRYSDYVYKNGNSARDDNDGNVDNDKTTGMNQQRLMNLILMNKHKFRDYRTSYNYLIPPLADTRNEVNASNEKRSVYQTRIPTTTTRIGLFEKAGLLGKSVSVNRSSFNVYKTSEMPGTSTQSYTSDTVTYKPMVPVYTGANISLKYKDKEWGMFVKELSEMFLEVNRMKKSNLHASPVGQSDKLRLLEKMKLATSSENVKARVIPRDRFYGKHRTTTSPPRATSSETVKARVVPRDRFYGKHRTTTSPPRGTSSEKVKARVVPRDRFYGKHRTTTSPRRATSSEKVKARVVPRDRFYGKHRTTTSPSITREYPVVHDHLKRKSLQTSNTTDCVYQGRRYRPGETWLTKCNKTCICYRGFHGRYMCEKQRCLSTTEVPRGCTLKTQRSGCCGVLECPGTMNITSNQDKNNIQGTLANGRPNQQTLVKYVRTSAGIIRLTQTGNANKQWVGTFLPNINQNAKAFCRYKHRKYVTGEIWHDGCNSCQCVNGMFARYTCHMRCPSFNHIPDRCSLHVVSKQQCCPVLKCNEATATVNTTSSTKRFTDWMKASMATQKSTGISSVNVTSSTKRFTDWMRASMTKQKSSAGIPSVNVTSSTKRFTDWMRASMATQKNAAISPIVQTFFVPKTRATTETPFVRERLKQELTRLRNNAGVLNDIKKHDHYNISAGKIGNTKAQFDERWRKKIRKSLSRNTPRGMT